MDQTIVATLLAQAGIAGDFALEPLAGGANNRVFRVRGVAGDFLLKSYFYHPDDRRDRLKHEFSFSNFVWRQGMRNIPQPLAQDVENHLGLYEFVRGRKLEAAEIDAHMVNQAREFFLYVNDFRREIIGRTLPNASEACFGMTEHLSKVAERVARLSLIDGKSEIDRAAKGFAEVELQKLWNSVRIGIEAEISALDEDLSQECRCISPSDFGFHNALLREDGTLCFIDFEYAGWDDPAKWVCDFFCQPALPVPLEHLPNTVSEVCRAFVEDDLLERRISLLLPAYRIKWCCILLNDFLPIDASRRRFAESSDEHAEDLRKEAQLEKAKSLFAVCSAKF